MEVKTSNDRISSTTCCSTRHEAKMNFFIALNTNLSGKRTSFNPKSLPNIYEGKTSSDTNSWIVACTINASDLTIDCDDYE